ncbi:hypothetical protein [Curtobacterium sp. MCBD17_003]|uniref:hypothetical protein n=1 Tax=Curtobacterium sp. MCBD17_003 TaxID=2175667 RepID=UPI000DA84AAE|nr:hypothetical protein [Curtobacterium sp. MCBD17_003]WIE54217.1 hypothetical protein DEI88_013995 [Curtobacterium sp. MCBD17_003]
MPAVKITMPVGGHDAGDTVEVTRGAADYLTASGYAEQTTAAQPKRTRRAKPKPKDDGQASEQAPEGVQAPE